MIKWKNEYKTNNPIIDAQHKQLFELAMESEILLLDEFVYDKYDDILSKLTELKTYTEYHFKTEENLMELSNYLGIESHKQMHEDFICTIGDLMSRDIDENQTLLLSETLDFLVNWIITHICKIDIVMASSL